MFYWEFPNHCEDNQTLSVFASKLLTNNTSIEDAALLIANFGTNENDEMATWENASDQLTEIALVLWPIWAEENGNTGEFCA